MSATAQERVVHDCPPCNDGEHATVEDNVCTCCGETEETA